MAKKYAIVDRKYCVSCGACQKVCPKGVIAVWKGCFAVADTDGCVGCGLCARVCPANAITYAQREDAQ